MSIPVDDSSLDAAAANVKNEAQLAQLLQTLETQMREAAKKFEFEKAASVARPDSRAEAARRRGALFEGQSVRSAGSCRDGLNYRASTPP